MANTKVTSNVLADDAVTIGKIHSQADDGTGSLGNQDPSDGHALVAKANSNGYHLSWESVGVSGISSSADGTAITIDSSENVTFSQKVGIGASTIDAQMHIEVSSGDANLKLEDGSATYMLLDQNSIGGSDVIRFKTGSSLDERMRVASTGQVLINSTNANLPSDYSTIGTVATCIINGNQSAATDNALFVYGGRIALNAHPDRYSTRGYIQCWGAGFDIWHRDNSDMRFAVNDTERMRIQWSDGRIKSQPTYDNTAPATHRDVYVENSGQLGYASSVRAHKTNITDYGDASWLYSINPKTFNYRKKNMDIVTNDDGVEHEVFNGTYSDTEYYDTVEVGFIAEDVEEHDSNLCFYNEVEDDEGNITNELAGIHYKAMVAPMLKLIKEQKTLIDDLTTRIETLEAN